MGVVGSFEKEKYVNQLSELGIDWNDTLNRLVGDVQRATLVGSARVIKNHPNCWYQP